MKLFLQTTIVFLGTLIAAALIALGAPGDADVQIAVQAQPAEHIAALFAVAD